jgi:hypothetical protein
MGRERGVAAWARLVNKCPEGPSKAHPQPRHERVPHWNTSSSSGTCSSLEHVLLVGNSDGLYSFHA